MAAANGGHTECTKALLECGANARLKTTFDATALMFACEKNHVECVRALLTAEGEKEANRDLFLSGLLQCHSRTLIYYKLMSTVDLM